MLAKILGSLGGNLGKHFGGGMLSTIGRYAGRMAGNYLEQKWFHQIEHSYKYHNIRDGFTLSLADYGDPIPLVFGQMRVPGKIIWADEIDIARLDSERKKYFRQSHYVKSVQHDTELQYSLSFAVAICEGAISEITRIWADDELIDVGKYKFRLYYGGETQEPDHLINSKMAGEAPAFRDLAYIMFEDLPLADFGDHIPNFSFEVIRKPKIEYIDRPENLVRSMVMIPGSGEYVYDTKVITKTKNTEDNSPISTRFVNSHNSHNIADSIESLNQLQSTCRNLEWLSLVACWFGDNMDAKDCLIKPAVEFKDETIVFSEEWRIGKYDRSNAYEISKDERGNPAYGGSVNDASILRYLEEVKKRNLKMMFYPMIFMDVKNKPWRGRLSCAPEEVQNFFRKSGGYNEFILHYALLVKDHVNAFVIGSELIGLTKIRQGNSFPAVQELINLAKLVKQIVGPNVLVTYAADWSEYHHTDGGWYNLDPLWASQDIDFIGIDAYFPVTNSSSSAINDEQIKAGFDSGEGYDYYLDQDGNKQPLSPAYAWKNIEYWWSNQHQNPDGSITEFIPKSKKIWFTEFGFPSINKATNQPNVFFDPICLDGGVPKESNGEIDFAIQRRAIKAFLKYWSGKEYIDQMFLWTWDARPYPAWPYMAVWRDGHLWERGHWVNNKFGSCSLADIIAEISDRCGIPFANIQVKDIDEVVNGLFFAGQISGTDSINMLRVAHFFDMDASLGEQISFVKRGLGKEVRIKANECIKLSDNSLFSQSQIPKEVILSQLDLYWLDRHKDYAIDYEYINSQKDSFARREVVKLPLVLSKSEAENLGRLIIQNASAEDRIIHFILPLDVRIIQPCDFVILNQMGKEYHLRIMEVKIENLRIYVTAVVLLS